MSTNIYIMATRDVIVKKTGKSAQQQLKFNAWQTPTTSTAKIMEKRDKIQAYKDWVLSVSKDKIINVYAEDDIWREYDPVATQVINEGEEHIKRFDEWLDDCEQNGYDVEIVAW